MTTPGAATVTAHATTHRLRFNDTDRLGHVNNAVFAVMLEQGRSELAVAAGLPVEPPAEGRSAKSGDARSGSAALVIVRLELDFLQEMTWPGDVRVETEVAKFGAKSFQLRQRLTSGGDLCARAMTVLVVMDRATRKAVPLTPEWRGSLDRWLVPDAPAP